LTWIKSHPSFTNNIFFFFTRDLILWFSKISTIEKPLFAILYVYITSYGGHVSLWIWIQDFSNVFEFLESRFAIYNIELVETRTNYKKKNHKATAAKLFFFFLNSGIFLLNIKKIRQALKNSLIILLNLAKLVNIETSQPDSLSRSSIK
jgi:hypothetical protein